MKLLSAILILLSSTDFSIAVEHGVRGAGVAEHQEEIQQQSARGLVRKDNDNENNGQGSGRFGNPDKGKKDDDGPQEVVTSPQEDETEDEEDTSGAPAEFDPMVDVAAAAETLGLTVPEAALLLRQQQEFAELVDEMQDDKLFMEAEMPTEPDGEFIVKYKNGNVPPKRKEGIDKFKQKNKKASVKTVATNMSMKDAEGRGERLAEKLEKKGYSQVSYSLDGDSIQITAKKSPNDKNKDNGAIPNSRTAEILELPQDAADMEQLSLYLAEYDDEDLAGPDHTYGGRKIYGNGECTTAFSVISWVSGATGIATAGHCTGMNRYNAVYPELDYDTYYQKQHLGIYGDVEWHTTAHIEKAEYYACPICKWPVNRVGYSISRGQTICAYSRMQGKRRCDTVFSTNVSVKYSGLPRIYKLVAMTHQYMVRGDSGVDLGLMLIQHTGSTLVI